jgi:hypothetical protein
LVAYPRKRLIGGFLAALNDDGTMDHCALGCGVYGNKDKSVGWQLHDMYARSHKYTEEIYSENDLVITGETPEMRYERMLNWFNVEIGKLESVLLAAESIVVEAANV